MATQDIKRLIGLKRATHLVKELTEDFQRDFEKGKIPMGKG